MRPVLRSRDIWTHGGGWPLPDLLRTAFASLLLSDKLERAAYFASPWITDFDLFDNRFREFATLFPRQAEQPWIRFSDYLRVLSSRTDVRLLTTNNIRSATFMDSPALKHAANVTYRISDSAFHEKGILAPRFYIEGSMNITQHGVRVRGEKVVYHSVVGKGLPPKIAQAYLEFDRHWENLT